MYHNIYIAPLVKITNTLRIMHIIKEIVGIRTEINQERLMALIAKPTNRVS